MQYPVGRSTGGGGANFFINICSPLLLYGSKGEQIFIENIYIGVPPTNKMKSPYHRRVPYAKSYVVSKHGQVINRGKSLRTKIRSGSRYASLYCDDKVRRYVNIDKLVEDLFEENLPVLDKEMILDRLDARIIPDWIRYAITSYGAVFCIEPPKRGYKAGRCYLVREREIRGDMYVTLYAPLIRKTLKVDDLIRSTWNY